MSADDVNVGRILNGKYELIRVIGEGGMGTVYEARHRLINRRLALKLLLPEYADREDVIRRFKAEARASAAIGHDHIVHITDMGIAETGEIFIAMEFLEGCDLEHVIENVRKENTTLSPKRACHILIQVLSALEAAHGKGIVHRDLKPANIFLTRHRQTDDYAKLLDFGISKVRASDTDLTQGMTRTGMILGTPHYMSPEQARGDSDVGPATDIYSAGVILYEMMTGILPFSESFPLLLVKILTEDPLDPRMLRLDLPEALNLAIQKAMAKDKARRFPDAAAFRRALTEFSPNTAIETGLASTRVSMKAAQLAEELGSDWTGSLITSEQNATTPFATEETASATPGSGKKRLGIFAGLMGLGAAILAASIFLAQEKKEEPPEPRAFSENPNLVATPPLNLASKKQKPSTNVSAQTKITNISKEENKKPDMVRLSITVTPPYARVTLDGTKLGSLDMERKIRRDERVHELIATAPGFEDHREEISLRKDVALRIRLSRTKTRSSTKTTPRKPKSSQDTPPPPRTTPEKPEPPENETKPLPQNEKPHVKKKRKIDEAVPW